MMNIVILYKSKDISNALSSSARDQLKRKNLLEHVTFWNVNKRHVDNIKNRDKIDAVFVCEESSLEISWYKEFLKCDHWFVYSRYICKKHVDDNGSHYVTMTDCIHNFIKKSSGTVRRFVVRSGTIYQEDVYVCDLQSYHFTSFDSAKKVAIKWLNERIDSKKLDIDFEQQRLKEFENQLELLKNSSE